MDNILWTIYCGQYFMENISWAIYYEQYITGNILWTICHGQYVVLNILWTICYGNYIMDEMDEFQCVAPILLFSWYLIKYFPIVLCWLNMFKEFIIPCTVYISNYVLCSAGGRSKPFPVEYVPSNMLLRTTNSLGTISLLPTINTLLLPPTKTAAQTWQLPVGSGSRVLCGQQNI
jgi:hypothetical protein